MATRFPMATLAGDMVSLRTAMDRLFNESFVPGQMGASMNGALPLDVYGTEDEVILIAAIPGMDADDIAITIDKNTVSISGTMPNVAESEDAKGATWYLHELPSGTFERSLTLPFALDANGAEASFEDGMLRLTLPKAENEKPRQIKVNTAAPRKIAVEADPDTNTQDSDSE